MLIKQISVFIENMPGKLGEVTQVLGENGIDMSALSLADTTDFGILRLIVNDPDKACQVLRNHDFIVKQSDVVAAVIDDRPGGLTAVLQILSGAQVSVEYMYAFVGNQDGPRCGGEANRQRRDRPPSSGGQSRFNPGPKRYLPTANLSAARLPFSGEAGFFLDRGMISFYNIIK